MNCMITHFFLWALSNGLGLVDGSTVTYKELQQLGVGCYPEDSCVEPRTEDSPGISSSYSCSCNRLCSQLDTCCVDSYYNSVKLSTIRPSCRSVNLTHGKTAYFMVDRCSSDGNGESSAWEELCNEEWAGDDDLMRHVPVTSLFTFMTYKNYFCFRCHETTDDYSYWKLWLVGTSSTYLQPALEHELQYDSNRTTWTVTFADGNISIPVHLKLDIPFEIWSLPVECLSDVISDCSHDWSLNGTYDPSVRDKCHAYTAVVVVKNNTKLLKYKNAHCALCNFESLETMSCKTDFNSNDREEDFDYDDIDDDGVFPFDPHSKIFNSGNTGRTVFSFVDLLPLQDKGKAREIRCKEKFLWDPYRNQCRPLLCALPGYAVIKNKCVRV